MTFGTFFPHSMNYFLNLTDTEWYQSHYSHHYKYSDNPYHLLEYSLDKICSDTFNALFPVIIILISNK